MSTLMDLLNTVIVDINGHQFTTFDILIVPTWLLFSFTVTKFFIGSVANKLKNKKKDPNVIQVIERGLFIVATVVIFLTTLSLLKIPITAFAFLSGAIAIGFGFGAQNIINNFISGWILIGEKPIRIGDFLEVENTKGIVEEINTRSTRIRRVDGVHLLVPNSKLLENTVINWTLRDHMVRGVVSVGVAYGSPCKQVSELIMQATKDQPEVLQDPKTVVFFQEFGDNALIFEVYFWINSQVEGGLRSVASNIRFRLDELLAQNNIVIAYPQRDIHIDGKLTIQRTNLSDANNA
jgi:small-conductance mechanosensitive channel